jgi:hypothetical protein
MLIFASQSHSSSRLDFRKHKFKFNYEAAAWLSFFVCVEIPLAILKDFFLRDEEEEAYAR